MQTSQHINKSKYIFAASGKQRIISAIILMVLGLFFGSFAIAGHKNVDMGQYLGKCGFKALYNLPCPTCGYTTAMIAFSQGKIVEAFNIQPACAFICSVLLFIAIISFLIAFFGIKFKFVDRFFSEVKIRHIIVALIIIVISGWAVTLAKAVAQNSHP